MQGDPERAMNTMGRWVLGWPAEAEDGSQVATPVGKEQTS
jgi:hypothetical protein